MIKVMWIFRIHVAEVQSRAILGAEIHDGLMSRTRKQNDTTTGPIIYRVVGKEIMGKMLPPSAGVPSQDPSMCQHPPTSVTRRANKSHQWWTCKECKSRWERMDLTEVQPQGPLNDLDLVTFGRHMGHTYEEVFQDIHYAQHILQTAEQEANNPPLRRLAQYLAQKEADTVTPLPQDIPVYRMEEEQ